MFIKKEAYMTNVSNTTSAVSVLLVIAIVIVSFFGVCNFLPRPKNHADENPLRRTGELPILVAHRGGDGEFPGNTLEAFYNAYGVDERVIMETDVNITEDGVLILCHETYLDKRTDAKGNIVDWTYADLMEQKVNFGYHNKSGSDELYPFADAYGKQVKPSDLEGYPEGLDGRDSEIYLATTVEDLLTAFPNNIVSLEIKQSGEIGLRAVKEALRLIEKYNAWNRVILASFHDEIYEEYKRLDKSGEVPDSFMYSPSMGGAVKYFVLYLLGLDVFFTDEISLLQIPTDKYGFNLSSKRLIKNATKHNLATHYWTINDEDEMRMLIENGADAIMTDYPHKLKEVLDSYK